MSRGVAGSEAPAPGAARPRVPPRLVEGRPLRVVDVALFSWSSLAPLALGDAIPRAIRERLANEHLLHPRRYGARFGVPSVSMEELDLPAGLCPPPTGGAAGVKRLAVTPEPVSR